MASKRKSSLEEERMTDTNISKVISMLEDPPEGDKPWTKKECCQYLGMAYNTTRLGNLIDKYKEDKARDQARRAQLRGKPATRDEAAFIIQEYLEDVTVDAISKSTYRSPQFIKQVLASNNVPIRSTSHDYFKPELIPDGAVQEKFEIGEIVYNARYDSIAKIVSEQKTEQYGWIYRVWLLSDKWLQYANSEAYELASLKHLRELGVRV